MSVHIPRNTFADIWDFFWTTERPLYGVEMLRFWESLTASEKHYYMCADLIG